MLEVGDGGGKLDIEPSVENTSVQVRPLAFVFASIDEFGGGNVFETGFDLAPDFVGGLARTHEVGIGVDLDVFEDQTVEVVTGQGLQPALKGFERSEQGDAAVNFVHGVSLRLRQGNDIVRAEEALYLCIRRPSEK